MEEPQERKILKIPKTEVWPYTSGKSIILEDLERNGSQTTSESISLKQKENFFY